MLIEFRLSNFKSFRDGARLTLRASADKRLGNSVLDAPSSTGVGLRILPTVAIYGANAAGKTNLIVALDYMQDAVALSQTQWGPLEGTQIPFTATQTEEQSVSVFELELLIDGVRHVYGFAANSSMFLEEWLYNYPKGRERVLFQRQTTDRGDEHFVEVFYGDSLSGDERYFRSIKSRVRPNSLFLSAAAQDNQSESKRVFAWIVETLQIAPIGNNHEPFQQANTSKIASSHEDFRGLMVSLMRMADPAIKDIIITETKEDASVRFLSQVSDPQILKILQDQIKYKVSFLLSDGVNDLVVPFESESRGVKKLYALSAYLLSCLKDGNVLVVDEIESSMHPHMARFIVDMFQNREINRKGAQLIFTTHNTDLLDKSLLRRDQVWFVQKNGLNSELYPLKAYKPRNDEDLEKGYLRGRYGAVPRLAMPVDWLAALHAD